MQPISIALITPTLGRSSLTRTLKSALPQLSANDEWFIIGDGPQPHAREAVAVLNDERIRYREHVDPSSSYGNSQRNRGMREAQADYFVFLDDDDTLLHGALDAVRREAASGAPLMFRMDYRPGQRLVWEEPVVRVGNVGGAIFVIPNQVGRWAEWPQFDQSGISDFAFITQTLALWPPGALRWCEDMLCRCDWHGGGQPSNIELGRRVVIHPTANIYRSSIGDDTKVAAYVEIGGASVGARCKIQAFAFIPPGVTIGDDVFIGPHACFTNDRYPRAGGDWTRESTVVEHGASLGANSTILPGVTIGQGAMVGAGITVTRDVPADQTIRDGPW
ncbi:MAG: glycosyltransferase [Planctomycetota bacterium]|nr:MAG: glycosyltransferase [Planctomycetota bacterium]REK25324.1 MAG: glycosyltransferase [Planctomycetota bacterium]REK31797.1 MAG: glycosyltransferase [Planctomycetota bacterium]